MELIAPAGNLAALKAAVLAGADAVYLGLKNATNARNFAGLNFTEADIAQGVAFARQHGRQVLFAINTFAQPGRAQEWRAAVDAACRLGADALILADPGVLAYARQRYPQQRLHLSVQGSATHADAIELMREQFGIQRVVLPRVLTVADIARLIEKTTVEVEVFGFGSLCVMAEGRCLLSSFATGDSPNNRGVCSPAHAVRWQPRDGQMEARLNGLLIDRYAPDEPATIPPRKNAALWEEGHPRNEAVEALKAGELAEWKKQSGYHQRSKAETAMYRYKQLISPKLSLRNHNGQVGEMLAGVKVLNKVIGLGMPVRQPLN
jgi:putative protease